MKLSDIQLTGTKELLERLEKNNKKLYLRKDPVTHKLEEVNFLITTENLLSAFYPAELKYILDELEKYTKFYKSPKPFVFSDLFIEISIDVSYFDFNDENLKQDGYILPGTIEDNATINVVLPVTNYSNSSYDFKTVYGFTGVNNELLSERLTYCLYQYLNFDNYNSAKTNNLFYLCVIIEEFIKDLYDKYRLNEYDDLLVSNIYWLSSLLNDINISTNPLKYVEKKSEKYKMENFKLGTKDYCVIIK